MAGSRRGGAEGRARARRPVTSGSHAYKESLRTLILRILLEGPQHGYSIMKRIEEVTEGRWRPAAGTVYTLLESMREEGLIRVAGVEELGVRGGRRVVYEITPEGLRVLADILMEKAGSKAGLIRWLLLEGAVLLRERGLDGEAREICERLLRGLAGLRELAGRLCGPGVE